MHVETAKQSMKVLYYACIKLGKHFDFTPYKITGAAAGVTEVVPMRFAHAQFGNVTSTCVVIIARLPRIVISRRIGELYTEYESELRGLGLQLNIKAKVHRIFSSRILHHSIVDLGTTRTQING